MRMPPRCFALVFFLISLAPRTTWSAWQLDGIPIGGNQNKPAIASDGAGGAIIAWADWRSDGDIYVRRIDAAGNPLWTVNGVALCTAIGFQTDPTIVTDGAGGAIVAWVDARSGNNDIYARRINAAGTPLWTADGVAVCVMNDLQVEPVIASDGAGGAIIAWSDNRNSHFDVFASRIDGAGNTLWASDGVPVCTTSGNQLAAIVADGAGGAILAWGDGNVFAQRINATGNAQWTVNGVALCTAADSQTDAVVVSDGAAGAIVAWSDYRSGDIWPDLYARRIDASGNPLWIADGIAVCPTTNIQTLHAMVSDGFGGAILAWADGRNAANGHDLYAQRINSAGGLQWTAAGVALATGFGDQTSASIVSDGSSGAVVTWLDRRGGTFFDVYAQRVVASGGAHWTVGGVAVCTANGEKGELVSVSDGAASVIAAWTDQRHSPSEIYAQRVEFRFGFWGYPEPDVTSVYDVGFDQGAKVEIEWHASQRDVVGDPLIGHYSIWRTAEAALPWELVGIQDATQQPTYTFTAPTLFDSTAANPADHWFQVIAHAAADPLINWPSDVMSGHSVDNLAPPPPANLTAERLPTGGVQLQWEGVSLPDFNNYAVYRWRSPGPSQFLMSSVDPTAIDADAPNEELRYVVTAIDIHENEGPPSDEAIVDPVTGIGGTPRLTALTVLQNHPNPFAAATDFKIGLPSNSDVTIDVFDVAGRRVSTIDMKGAKAGWQRVPFAGRDDRGRSLASGVYFYRVKAAGTTMTKKMVISR